MCAVARATSQDALLSGAQCKVYTGCLRVLAKIALPAVPAVSFTRDQHLIRPSPFWKGRRLRSTSCCTKGGTCVASCPSGSIQQKLFEDQEIFEEVEGLLAYA
jgi:ferredoxin